MSGNRHDPVDRVAEWVIEHQARRALYTAECRHPFAGDPCLFVDDDDARNERGLADGGVVTDFGGWEPMPAPYRGKTWLLQPRPDGLDVEQPADVALPRKIYHSDCCCAGGRACGGHLIADPQLAARVAQSSALGTRIELSFDQRCLDGGVAITPERMAELIRGMHRNWERALRASGRLPGWARP